MTKRVLFLTAMHGLPEWLQDQSDWEVVAVRSPDPAQLLNIVDHFDAVDGVVATSRLAHRWLVEKLPDEAERIHYVRPGVRPPSMPRVESETLRVGYLGRLDLDLPSISWTRLHGDYPQLDVLLLFSEAPDILLKAMHHGVVPVVARYRGVAAEGLVIDGETGLIFGDREEAARLIARLGEDRELLARLSANAKSAAAEDTDVRMHRDWLAVLERMRSMEPKGREPVVSSNLAKAFRALFRQPQQPVEALSANRVHEVLMDLERLDRA
ncbi:MAG TPA: hypothetical protein VKB93_24960 [Thermoanaerobaculia bacterium]|nr:hypothetical protein [Thermoanaerobaculia bacterium]